MSRSFPRTWRIVLACLLIVPGFGARAGDVVYKCRGSDGQPHYQAAPCAPTQRTEWVRPYAVESPAPQAPARSVSPPEKREQRPRAPAGRGNTRRRQASVQGAVISLHRDAAACERAKQARDQAYARLGLKRDFATSRKLDDRINAACR